MTGAGAQAAEKAALVAEVKKLRDEVAAAQREKLAGGTKAANELEAERERRVAHIGQMAAKRMGNRKLAVGWTAWHGEWEYFPDEGMMCIAFNYEGNEKKM